MSQNSLLQTVAGIGDRPSIRTRQVPYAPFKRFLDIVGSVILLVLLLPVYLLIALSVRLTSKGPVFYKCDRVGLGGRVFKFVKFRSMYVDADERLGALMQQNEKDGPIFKMKRDPRITPVGRFLRKYSLDELPQLVNVFKGEMSLVGPRPPLPREVEQYDDYAMQRLSVKPGISCYWQIMGRSDLSFQEWMDLDHRYIREMSFWTDLMILLKTPLAVLRGRGAY
ncbi:MAG TPA: exopolysaccharide biosynthesis polyprenyl glycosylphosphotransferase [Fimbriimonadaceae bacterium]|nr:exopolysaccharide biosynthesis polyprenyl glycosylphosphotransferase [Fimbriimonadaceae bacterium]